MFRMIEFSETDGVATLVLNRPGSLNALSLPMIEEIISALDQVRDGGTTKSLLVKAAGRAFCSGADLAPAEGSPAIAIDALRQMEVYYNPLIERLHNLPVPTVAAVQGSAAGGGCSIALAVDFCVASRSAYFLQAFVNIGLIPDLGSTWMLPRMIGTARAKRMMMLGERIDAYTAAQWGMIHEVVEDERLDEAAEQLARHLADGPTLAYRLIRQAVADCVNVPLAQALAIEKKLQLQASRSQDAAEGITAFVERRKAQFCGR